MATEKRLIDANVVLAKKFTTGLSDASGNYYGYADVVFADDIEKCPTVDAVEVVRCKDCQKCLIDNSKMELHLCMKRPSFPVRVKLDGFCSDGERKDGDGNG